LGRWRPKVTETLLIVFLGYLDAGKCSILAYIGDI